MPAEDLGQLIGGYTRPVVDHPEGGDAGQIAGAAGRVESALGDVLTLVISFLANFLGLTNVTEKIMDVVHKVQAYVDKALDTAVGWIVG